MRVSKAGVTDLSMSFLISSLWPSLAVWALTATNTSHDAFYAISLSTPPITLTQTLLILPLPFIMKALTLSLASLSILQKVAKITLNCKLHTKMYVLVVEVSVIQVCLPKHVLDDLHNLKIKLSQSRLNT